VSFNEVSYRANKYSLILKPLSHIEQLICELTRGAVNPQFSDSKFHLLHGKK